MSFNRNELFLTTEEKKSMFWALDDVHFSEPFTALFASYMIPAISDGTEKAFESIKAPMKQFLIRSDNGYYYQAVLPFENIEERLEEHKKTVGPMFPHLVANFQDYLNDFFYPFYKKLDEYRNLKLTPTDALEKLEELYEGYKTAWDLHFRVVMSRGSLGFAFETLFAELTKIEDPSEAYELLVGKMNKTLEADREYWMLGNQVKENKELFNVFQNNEANDILEGLKTSKDGQEFLSSLQDVLEKYGYRTVVTHEFAEETWIENPIYALGLVKSYVEKDYDFDAEFKKVTERREEKLQEILALIPDGEEKEQFKALHQFALDAWGLDEDHNVMIDQMLPAKSRFFLLNVGSLLVEQGVINNREDIFHLYLDEVKELLVDSRNVGDLIDERKQLLSQQKAMKPALFFGEPPTEVDPIVERIFGLKPPKINEENQSFEGYAGSKGIYKGRVRFIKGQEEFHTFKKGDILVCKLTLPPWTVLFGLAGAIVTDTGGILSHTATVAREYKVPAVVGTKVATSLLEDGDIITVNGTEGVVTIESKGKSESQSAV